MPDEPVSVACPHCSVRLKLKDSSAVGKTIKCPKCAKSFTAEVAAPAPAAAVSGNGAPAKKKRPPVDEAPPEDEADEGEESAGDDAQRKKKKKKGKKKRKKQASGPPLPLILGISAFVLLLVAGGVV